MNYYDAMQIRLRHIQKQPVSPEALAEATRFIESARRKPDGEPPARSVTPPPPPQRYLTNVAPAMSDLCVCGLRYGMHRVGDFACMNQHWRPGNGQSQWTEQKFRRQ